MLQPNNLPLVCLPTDPSEAAAKLLEFLHELTAASNVTTPGSFVAPTTPATSPSAPTRRSDQHRAAQIASTDLPALIAEMTRFRNIGNTESPRRRDRSVGGTNPRLSGSPRTELTAAVDPVFDLLCTDHFETTPMSEGRMLACCGWTKPPR
jgi:hypothetical protein